MSLHEDRRVSIDGSVEFLPGTEPGTLHSRHPGHAGHGPSPLEHKYEVDTERNNRDSFEESTYYESEDGHDIKFKTLTWKKTAALLFCEYICLAIMSFPWSFSVLGFVAGVLITLGMAIIVLYTSYVSWQFCMAHPHVRDVCDIGRILFGGSKLAYELTMVGLILNNVFIMALHIVVGEKVLNTLSGHAICTVAFGAILTVIYFFFSLPRTLAGLSTLSVFSAVTMFISVVLGMIFSGVQDHPFGWPTSGSQIIASAWPMPSTNFVAGMSAMLNITYTLIGQIILPSFIAEMRDPREFPKVLIAVTVSEMFVFTIAGAVMYSKLGQYTTGSAYAALEPIYKKIAYGFAIPTIVMLGVLYASVVGRFLFFRIMRNSVHRYSHSLIGWGVWIAVIAGLWVFAFIIAGVIPFFNDLLSLMSSLFDSFFGFIFWGLAYLQLNRGHWWSSWWKCILTVINMSFIVVGLFFLSAGTYASVQSIIDDYAVGAIRAPFSCADNGL